MALLCGTKFPTWMHGPCYVLTMDLVRWVASSMEVHSKLKLEDVSTATWLDLKRQDLTLARSLCRSI